MTETPTLKTLFLLFSGFVAGFTVSQFISKDSTFAPSPKTCVADDWEQQARDAHWIEKAECPAYPLQVSITSPGDQSLVRLDSKYPTELQEKLVVKFSRPVPEMQNIHIASQIRGAQTLYVASSHFIFNADRTVATTLGSTNLEQEIFAGQIIDVWAVVLDEDAPIGDIYKNIQQLQANVDNAYLSDAISVTVQ